MTLGRGLALFFGVPIVAALIAFEAFSLVGPIGKGSFRVNHSGQLRKGELTLSLNGGDATIREGTSPVGSVRVSGTVDYQLSRPTVRFEPGSVRLACPGIDLGNCSLNGTVDVNAPAGAALTVYTGGGNLSASGLVGPDTLNTDGGTLTVSGEAGGLTAETGGGNVTVGQVSGAQVTLNSDGGNVNGTELKTPQVNVTSGGGDVTLKFARGAVPRDVQVNSDGGDVTIDVPTAAGGYRVYENSDGGTVAPFTSRPHSTNVITVNSGGGNITVQQVTPPPPS
jgi:hypothetical protein